MWETQCRCNRGGTLREILFLRVCRRLLLFATHVRLRWVGTARRGWVMPTRLEGYIYTVARGLCPYPCSIGQRDILYHSYISEINWSGESSHARDWLWPYW